MTMPGAPADAVPPLGTAVADWYAVARRDLPWRVPGASPWAVLVSEVMLQQTPVARVVPAWTDWLRRWPTPAALAAAPSGEAVRRWDRLGYPRRALRLHECARAITDRFGGQVPDDVVALESLPGIGPYTARAVAVFAHGQRHPVVDTNVRRVVARAVHGRARPGAASTTRDHADVDALLPASPAAAATVGIALMELGALVCTARRPACAACPVRGRCAWVAAGSPAHEGPPARTQRFAGTDREVRGRLLAVLRGTSGAVVKADLDLVWHDAAQRERALDSLVADGLVDPLPDGRYALPS